MVYRFLTIIKMICALSFCVQCQNTLFAMDSVHSGAAINNTPSLFMPVCLASSMSSIIGGVVVGYHTNGSPHQITYVSVAMTSLFLCSAAAAIIWDKYCRINTEYPV